MKQHKVAIIGAGRKADEHSIVLVENGNYLGFGFFDKKEGIGDFESARNLIQTSKDNKVVQNVINSYLLNPRNDDVITF